MSRNILSIVDIDESSGEFIPGNFCKILTNGKVTSNEDELGGVPYGYIYQLGHPGERTQVITLGQVEAVNSVPFIPGEDILTNSMGEVKGFSSATDYDPGPIPGGDPNGNYRVIGRATSTNAFIISQKLETLPNLISALDRLYAINSTINLQARTGIIRGDLTVQAGIELTVRSGLPNSWGILQVEGNITLEANAKIKLVRVLLYCKGNIVSATDGKIYTVNGGAAGKGGDGGDSALHIQYYGGNKNGEIGSLGAAMESEYGISGTSGKGGGGGGGYTGVYRIVDSNHFLSLEFSNGISRGVAAGNGDGGGGGGGNSIGFTLTGPEDLFADSGAFPSGSSLSSTFGAGGVGGNSGPAAAPTKAFAGGGGGGSNQPSNVYSGSAGTGPTSDEDGHGRPAPTLDSPVYVSVGTNATRADRAGSKAGDGISGYLPSSIIGFGLNFTFGGCGGGGGPGGSNAINLIPDSIFAFLMPGAGGAGSPGTPTSGANIAIICLGTIDSNLIVQSGKGGARALRSLGGNGNVKYTDFLAGDISGSQDPARNGANGNITSHGGTGNIYFITPALPTCTTNVASTTNSDLGVTYADSLPTPVGPAGTVFHFVATPAKVNEVLADCLYNSKISYTI
jgi:hypothetical protein